MDSIFDVLAELPLFKGASRERLESMVGVNKFHFLKYLPGEVIIQAGKECTEVAFILSGRVSIRIENPDGRFSVTQTLNALDVISPEFLFGRVTKYPGTVTALDTTSILLISKQEYLRIMTSDSVFLFNYLNLLSMTAQKSLEGILAVSTGDLPERIAFWISALTQPRSYDIHLECKQRDLVALFGVPRTSLRAALEEMKEKGLVDFSPYGIDVKNRRELLNLLHNHSEQPD